MAATRMSDRRVVFTTVAVSLVFGALVGLSGAYSAVGLLAAIGGILCVLFPVPSGLALLMIPYLYNLASVSFGGVVDIRVLEVGWLLVAAGLLFSLSRDRRLPAGVVPGSIIVPAVLLLTWELLSALVAGGIDPVVEVIQTTYLFVVAMMGAKMVRSMDPGRVDRALSVAGVVFIIWSVIGLFGYAFPAWRTPYYVATIGPGFSVVNTVPKGVGFVTEYGISRYSLANLGAVTTAAVMLMALVIAASRVLDDSRSGGTLIARAVSLAAAISLVLTLSRAAWLIGVAAIVWLVVRSGHRKAIPATVVIALALSVVVTLPAVQTRLEDIRNPEEGSNRSHTRLYYTAYYMANEAPLLGWGPGSFTAVASGLQVRGDLEANIDTTDAHNFVLQEAAEAGWPGAFLALFLLGRVLLFAYRRLRHQPLSTFGLYMGLVVVVLMGLTMNIFRTEILWSLVGLVVGVSALTEEELRLGLPDRD